MVAQVEDRVESVEATNAAKVEKDHLEAAAPAEPEVDWTGPPSERDEQIYEAICVESRTPASVARRFGLATTTVRNIALATQRKLARRQHELRQLGTRDSLLALYITFESQLQQVTDRLHHDTTVRTIQKTVRPEDQDGSPDPKGRVVTTIRIDPNIEVKQMKLAKELAKEMCRIEAEMARRNDEERRRAAAEHGRTEEGMRENLAREFDERLLREEYREQHSYRQIAAFKAREAAELARRETERRRRAEEREKQAEQERMEQLARKIEAALDAGYPVPPSISSPDWPAFQAELESRDDNWVVVRDGVSDAAEVEPPQGDAASQTTPASPPREGEAPAEPLAA